MIGGILSRRMPPKKCGSNGKINGVEVLTDEVGRSNIWI
jgi:hypothetical protein